MLTDGRTTDGQPANMMLCAHTIVDGGVEMWWRWWWTDFDDVGGQGRGRTVTTSWL